MTMVTIQPDARRSIDHTRAVLAAVAAFGLPTTRPLNLAEPPDDQWWCHVLGEVLAERMTGHLLAAVGAGAFPITAAQRVDVERCHHGALRHLLLLDQHLLRVVNALEMRGIDVRVLKGAAVAQSVYADPAARTYVDVDVLVPADRFDRATATLTEAGYCRLLPQLRRDFDRRFGKSATFVSTDGCQIDLHRTLVVGPYGLLIQLDDLFAARDSAVVGNCELPTLDPVTQLLAVCYHAALGDVPPRLTALRDIAETLTRTTVDTDRMLTLAERWGGQAVLARALHVTRSVLGLELAHPLLGWADDYQIGARDRRLLISYAPGRGSNIPRYVASLRVLPGIRARIAYLRALLFPEQAFLRARGPARLAWWAHGVSAAMLTRLARGRTSREQ